MPFNGKERPSRTSSPTRHGHSGHSGMTCIAAVLAIGTWTGYEVHLGLDRVDAALLVLTLFVSALTFGGASSNMLQGTVHLLLFAVYTR